MIRLDYENPSVNGRAAVTVVAYLDPEGGEAHRCRLDPTDHYAVEGFAAAVEEKTDLEGVAQDIEQQIAATWKEIAHPRRRPISARELIERYPEQAEPVVAGLLRETEVMIFASSSKAAKSWLVTMLALAVATGRMFLGQFSTRAGRVLLIDGELMKGTLRFRLQAVAAAMGLTPGEWVDRIDIHALRGEEQDVEGFAAFLRDVEPRQYGLVIIDPLYIFYPEGFDENSNTHMARLFRRLIGYAQQAGSAVAVVHHGTKGNSSAKAVADIGAGAGAQSRAADSIIALREHEEPDCAVFEAVLRSFPPMKPLALRREFPLWRPDPDLDPTKLKRDPTKGGRPRKADAQKPAEPEPEPWTPERFVAAFVGQIPIGKDVICSRARRERISERHINGLIAEAEHARLMFRHAKSGTNAVLYATIEPELFNGDAPAQEGAHTHAPPYPPEYAA